MLFDILSHLGSIRRGLACYNISYHALAVSAEAWYAILYLITSWQVPPRLGVLFYIAWRANLILSRLGPLTSSAEGPTSKNPSYESSGRKNNPELRKHKLQIPSLVAVATNLEVI